MGRRALVAVGRPDGRYDLRHSQWGADEAHLRRILRLADGTDALLTAAEPIMTGVSAAVVLDFLDPREYEALYVAEGSLTAYLVCRLGVETERETWDRATASLLRNAAVLVPVDQLRPATRLRRFCRTTKAVLGDAVDAGLLSPGLAAGYLAIRLSRRPDVPTDAVWLPLGRWSAVP